MLPFLEIGSTNIFAKGKYTMGKENTQIAKFNVF